MNDCISSNKIEKCNRYNSKGKCIGCEDGYFMKNNVCTVIAAEYNCRQMGEEGVCLRCLPDFILENGSCLDPLDYRKNQCENDTINGINTYDNQKCNYCRENAIPYNYKDSFVCVEN